MTDCSYLIPPNKLLLRKKRRPFSSVYPPLGPGKKPIPPPERAEEISADDLICLDLEAIPPLCPSTLSLSSCQEAPEGILRNSKVLSKGRGCKPVYKWQA